jgi:hypothetical protein
VRGEIRAFVDWLGAGERVGGKAPVDPVVFEAIIENNLKSN